MCSRVVIRLAVHFDLPTPIESATNTFMNAYDLGFIAGLTEHGMPLNIRPELEGFAKQASACQETWGRPILRLAARLLESAGMEKSAARFHLRLLNEQPWSSHSETVLHQVIDAVRAVDQQFKQASALGEMVNMGGRWAGPGAAGLGLAGKSLLYGGVGAGAGLGSLWWLLNRHASEDDAENESKQHQVDYYNRLANEVQETMNRNNDYQDARSRSN